MRCLSYNNKAEGECVLLTWCRDDDIGRGGVEEVGISSSLTETRASLVQK